MTSTIENEDVVERLRESAKAYRGMLHDAHADDCEKAADTIERLREENAESTATIKLQAQRLMELSSEIMQLRAALNQQ